NLYVLFISFASHCSAFILESRHQRRTYSSKRIKHPIPFVRECKHTPFHELDRKLTGVFGLFRMVVLHIRYIPQRSFPIFNYNFPNVRRVLAFGITRRLASLVAFEMQFAGILLRCADWIKVEGVLIGLSKPEDRLVSSGESFRRMEAVFKEPNNPVSEL